MDIGPIWTIDGRDSILLDVMAETLSLSDPRMGRILAAAHRDTASTLKSFGYNYDQLRTSLAPQPGRLERAHLFSVTTAEQQGGFHTIPARLVPLLPRDLRCSIQTGELAPNSRRDLMQLLGKRLTSKHPVVLIHPSDIYVVYLNNLSKATADLIDEELQEVGAYLGYVDVTYSDDIKTWLSLSLSQRYLKAGSRWLCHGEDAEAEKGMNVPGWPLEAAKYSVVAMPEHQYITFLTYKIERAPLPGEQTDNLYALASVSKDPQSMTGFTVTVEEAKLGYLREAKAGTMQSVGLMDVEPQHVAQLITERLQMNYLYNLRYNAERQQSFFNICLELPRPDGAGPFKVMASMEYKPDESNLKLVTFF